MSKYWSKALTDLVPYAPGEQPKVTQLVKLNTNENPYPPSPKVASLLQHFDPDNLKRYPDPQNSALVEAIAEHANVAPNHVFIGNGSDEVLAHAFMAFFRQPKPLLMPDISYGFYTVYANLYGIDARPIALRDDLSIDLRDYDSDNGGIIFANPNAPTSLAQPLAEIEALLQRNTESVVIVDEAYVDFGAQSAVELTARYDNCLVIQTLSKSRSLAGARIGFAIGHPDLIQGLERIKYSFNPYSLDMLAEQMATAAIQDRPYFDSCIKKIIATREHSTQALRALGFNVLESKTNFLFVSHPSHRATDLMQHLRAHNIIVRHFTKPSIEHFLRISIGTDEQMQQLLECLQNYLNSQA
ncbi:MAG: histidinol-phosphate transaminase [Pseudomonadales bacterium]